MGSAPASDSSGTAAAAASAAAAGVVMVPSPLPFLASNQINACLRVLRLGSGKNRTKKSDSGDGDGGEDTWSALREAADLFRGDPVESFLYLRLKVNYSQQKQQQQPTKANADEGDGEGAPAGCTYVYRDFVRLYQQLLVPPPPPEEEDEKEKGEAQERGGGGRGGAAKAPRVRPPHSLLVAARNVLDRLSHVDDDDDNSSSSAAVAVPPPEGLRAFVVASLGRLVGETTSALESVNDWDRLWDAAGPKFARPLPTCADHETSGRSPSQDGGGGGDMGNVAADFEVDDVLVAGTAGSGVPPSRQVELLAWKLFCVGLHCMPQKNKQKQQAPLGSPRSATAATATGAGAGDDADNDITDASARRRRRLRLTVACGALTFLAALYEATYPEHGARAPEDRDGGVDVDDDEPQWKKVRYTTLVETLVDTLKDPSARLNRFGVPHRTADAFAAGEEGITAADVEEQAEALAKLVWSVAAVSRPAAAKKKKAAAARKGGPTALPSKIKWLRMLEQTGFGGNEPSGQFFLSADQVVPHLAKTVDNLYQQANLRAASANDDGLVYDVGTLVELDSLDALDDPRRSRLLARLDNELSAANANRTVVAPPVFTEAMELNEWSVSLMGVHVVKPCPSLFDMVEAHAPGSVMRHIVPVLNRVLHRIGEEFVAESIMYRHMSVYVVDTGRVMIYGEDTSDKKFAKAVVALYYHALEAILLCERERLRASPLGEGRYWQGKGPPPDRVGEALHKRLVASPAFHTALLACCLLCVHKAVGATQLVMNHMNSFSAMHVCECLPEDFLKVAEAFHRSLSGATPARGKLGSSLVFSIPRLLWKEVRKAERNTLDIFLWKGEVNSFMDRVEGFRAKRFWPPVSLGPDDDDDPDIEDAKSNLANLTPLNGYTELRSMSYVFRRVLSVASGRIVSLLEFLHVRRRPLVARQAFVALRYLLRRHVDLLHDRHLDHMVLCCLYGVGRRLKYEPEITFGMLIDAYVAVKGQDEGDVTCQRIVRHIKLGTEVDDTSEEPIGDIIQLYNRVFVPRMKDYLLKSTSLQRAAESLKDPEFGRRSREAVAGAIQVSIRSNADRSGSRASGGWFRFTQGLVKRNGAVTVLEIGSPSSYKAAEVANELMRRSIPKPS